MVLTYGAAKSGVRYSTVISEDLAKWRVFKSSGSSSTTVPIKGASTNTLVRIPMSDERQFARVRVEYTGD